MNRTEANIDNLTSLWRSVSESFEAFHPQSAFDYAWLEDSGWPNRLWLHQSLPDIDLSQVRLHLMHLGLPLKIPYWHPVSHDHLSIFKKQGFVPGSVQIGMSMALDQTQSYPPQGLTAQLITSTVAAQSWSEIFQQAFGYYINPKQLISNKQKLCYLYSKDNLPVGTGLLHLTGAIAGIHAIGVPPTHRRKGYAEQIMFHLLNKAIQRNCERSTLQASDLGKGLYLKLGYQEDFQITNYMLSR